VSLMYGSDDAPADRAIKLQTGTSACAVCGDWKPGNIRHAAGLVGW